MTDACGDTTPLSDATLTFDSSGASPPPYGGPCVSGTYSTIDWNDGSVDR